MKFSMVLHAHQPPGNFDSVFQRALDVSYRPVLDLIEARPHLRLSLHYSGSLLEWLVAHAPEHVEQIRRLVQRGQVELVAAGMYEPVLALLPERDRVPQVLVHRAYLRRLFDADVTSGWLTERVWQQPIAADLADAGIEAVTLDDGHFLAAGVPRDALDAPFVTEAQGKPLRVVPVSESLRLAVPWRPVADAVALLRGRAEAGAPLTVYADDIEKFGMWPGTYEAVIQSGWLADFLDALGELDDVDVTPLGEAARAAPDRGRVYLPDGSYPEMLEWSLPARGQREYRRVRADLDAAGLLEEASPFLRAGNYLQFLAKYPEVDHLQKRMSDVSVRLADAVPLPAGTASSDLEAWAPEALPEARLDLWRAQANCAYWHGLFGGVYLPHIRQRLWRHLIRAERATPEVPLRVFDLDADLQDEVVLQSAALTAVVDPAEGAVVEVSDRQGEVNLADTLARREEGYHAPMPPGAAYDRAYDRGRRAMFVDRFLASGPPPTARSAIRDRGDFHGQPYTLEVQQRTGIARVVLARTARATPRAGATVRKTLRLASGGRAIEARYHVSPGAEGGRLDARFGIEFNLGVLFTEHPAGELRSGDAALALPRGGTLAEVGRATLRMEGIPTLVEWRVDPLADLDVRAVATTSEAEGVIEETPQQLALLFSWPLLLAGGEAFTPTVTLTVRQPRGRQP